VPGHARALVESIKEVERLTIQAALTRSRELAVKALALHPLVPLGQHGSANLRRVCRRPHRACEPVRTGLDVRAQVGMTVDVVCTGPVFLDLTFEGLDELPLPGRERFARELHQSPGGAGITAVGLARLGLRAAVVPGRATTLPGGRSAAARGRGRRVRRAEAERTPVSVIVPLGGERAIISYEPVQVVDAETIEHLEPRAVVVGSTSSGWCATARASMR
jgi:hypothetical protein